MYFGLAAVSALLAIFAMARPRAGVALFALWLAALPGSTAFDDWDYRFGLYAYDWFFLVLAAAYPYRALMTGRVPREFARPLLVLGGVVLASAVGMRLAGRALDKYVLRDLRPILLVLEGLVLFHFLQVRRVAYGERAMLWLGVVGGLSSFLGFALLATGVHELPDEFYAENRFRYLAVSSYVSAVVLVWIAARLREVYGRSPRLTACALAATAGATVLAGVRTLVAATALGALASGRIRPRRVVLAAVVGAVLVAAFAVASVRLNVTRVTDAASVAGITAQLLVRFGPALDALHDLRWWQVLVGSGMGATFEIPWFEYRGLDRLNNFVDSAYITLFVKYGLASLVYAWVLGRACGVGRLPAALSRGVVAFLLLLGVTMAIPYQKFAIAVPVCCAIALAVEARNAPRLLAEEVRP